MKVGEESVIYLSSMSQLISLLFLALQVLNLLLGENHNEVAACLCSIGTVYDDMSQEDLALSYFKKALSSVKGQTGAKSVRASALHNIGIILTKRHDIDHAVRIFREALELKLSGSGADDCSDTQYYLANVLRLTGCINEAVKLHKSALDTRLQYLGPDHVDVANSLFGLSQAFVDSGNHREAVKILTECVKIRKKIYGEQSDLFADANFILGTVLREVGNLSESLRCLKAALEVKALTCGESSDEVAEISFKLAIVLCEVGKYEEAKSYNAKSLAIRENTTTSSSYEIALILENMGTIEQKLGEHVLALERLKQAIEIKEARGGEGDHDVGQILHTMAISYFELEKYDHAIRFFEDAAKRKKRTFGPKSIEVARVLVDEGRVFERVGEHERALMCYEEAVDSDCFEDDSWELGRVFMRMGITHFALRKAEDAWDCLAEATRIFESVERRGKRVKEGSGRPSTRTTRDLHDLIKCYECIIRLSETNATRYNIDRSLVLPKVANVLVEIKEYQKASLLYQDAIVLLRSLPGDTRFIVATNLHNLGNCLHHLGDFNDALTSLEDALGLFQDIPGIEGKHVADTYHSLGVIHQSRSDMHEALTCYSNVLKSKRGDSKDGNVPLVSTLVSMGEVLRTLGMYDAAIKSCKDALRVLETKGESKQLMVARIVQCIGRTHKDRFEYEKSIRCHLESIKQYQDCLGSNNISTGKAIHELALVYTLKGDYEKAAEQFQQAYHIFKNYIGFGIQEHDKESQKGATSIKLLSEAITNFSEKCQGEFFIEDADAVLGLGSIMDNIGMKEEAMLCHEQAIKMIDDRLGPDHLSSALGKHRMGVMLFKKGLFEDSVSRLREALQTRRSKLGDNHIDTEDTLKTLSRAYAASGNSEMALFYFKEVVNIRKTRSSNKTDSDSEADLLLRLGKLHLEQQEYADALTCFKDSLRMQRQLSINREEQKLGETLLYMGWTLVEIDQFQEARLTLLSALRLLESGQDESKDLMNASYLLGRINEEERAFDKALAWYDRSLVILNTIDSDDFQMKARLLLRIGMLKYSQESFDDALQFVNEAQGLFSSCNGTQNLEYSDCVHSRGLIHFEIQEFSAAKEFFQLALQIRQQHMKTDDLEVGNSFHFLGAVLTELEQFEEARSCLEEALRIRRLIMGDSAYGVGDTQWSCISEIQKNPLIIISKPFASVSNSWGKDKQLVTKSTETSWAASML
jgi:tetratricopeptide (TPR) repeat protein